MMFWGVSTQMKRCALQNISDWILPELSALTDNFCNVSLLAFLMSAAVGICNMDWKLLKYSGNIADVPFSSVWPLLSHQGPFLGGLEMLCSPPCCFSSGMGQRGFIQRNQHKTFLYLLLNCQSPAHPQPFMRFSQSTFGVKRYYKPSGRSAG